MRRCVTAVTVAGPHPEYPRHKRGDTPGGNRRETGMRGLTSNELDLVSGGEVRVVINMGPVRIFMAPDEGFWFFQNGFPPPSLGHEPTHVGGPRPA